MQVPSRALRVLPLVLLAAVLAACSSVAPNAGASRSPSQPAATYAPAPAPAVAPPKVDHVVVIVFENKRADQIWGADQAPYLNHLAGQFAAAKDYTAITNPSLPNYIALTSGSTAGITDNCDPANCAVDVPNIGQALDAAGRSWGMYAEGMPSPCAAKTSGKYATKHVPFLYYKGITADAAGCARHVLPYSSFESLLQSGKLPDLSFVTPDLCNDMHDCSIATGDAWLSQQAPKILGSPAFAGNSLLVVTFDEGTKSDNRVATLFAGPAAKKGYASTTPYTHYSLLRTFEDLWGLQPLTKNDRAAAPMTDLLNG